jgi:hypothetical protein
VRRRRGFSRFSCTAGHRLDAAAEAELLDQARLAAARREATERADRNWRSNSTSVPHCKALLAPTVGKSTVMVSASAAEANRVPDELSGAP